MINKLFYLEDDEALAYMTVKAFVRRGFEVQHYSNIADAKVDDQLNYFSHALLDMKLTDGNSLSLVSNLAASHPNIKILLLTGYASIATAVQAIKLGAHNYIAKPAAIDEVMAAFGEEFIIDDAPEGSMSLKRLEWEKIQQALSENNDNITLTAKQLNMHRRTLQRKLHKRPVTQ